MICINKIIKEKKGSNVINIGHKPPMSYVLSVVKLFNDRHHDEIIIKARGKSINTGVDTVEIVINKYIKDLKIKEIKIGTEIVNNFDGGKNKCVFYRYLYNKKDIKLIFLIKFNKDRILDLG